MDQIVSPSARIKILMLQRNMKPADLARSLGLSISYVYGLMAGHFSTVAGRRRITDFFRQEIWPGIMPSPAARTSDRNGCGSDEAETKQDQVKNEKTNAGETEAHLG